MGGVPFSLSFVSPLVSAVGMTDLSTSSEWRRVLRVTGGFTATQQIDNSCHIREEIEQDKTDWPGLSGLKDLLSVSSRTRQNSI